MLPIRGQLSRKDYINLTVPDDIDEFGILYYPEVLCSGKNLIKLRPKDTFDRTSFDVEVLDPTGTPVYTEKQIAIDTDGRESIVLSIHILPSNPSGEYIVTVVGRTTKFTNTNIHNVMSSFIFDVDTSKANDTSIFFLDEPDIKVDEIRITQTLYDLSNSNLQIQSSNPATYRLQFNKPILITNELNSREYLGGTVEMEIQNILPTIPSNVVSKTSFTASIININNNSVELSTPLELNYTDITNRFNKLRVQSAVVPTFKLKYENSNLSSSTTENFVSYAYVQIDRLSPFSGFIKKARLLGRSISMVGDYETIGDLELVSNELLINTGSNKQFDRDNIGLFYDITKVPTFWNITNGSFSITNTPLPAALSIIHSSGCVLTSLQTVGVQKNSDYRIAFRYACTDDTTITVRLKSNKLVDRTNTALGSIVYVIDTRISGLRSNFSHDFIAPDDDNISIQLEFSNNVVISDISLSPRPYSNFTPGTFRGYIPITNKTRNDEYEFKLQLIDGADNVLNTDYDIVDRKPVSGSNTYIAGMDNIIVGNMTLGSLIGNGLIFNGAMQMIHSPGFLTSGQGVALFAGTFTPTFTLPSGWPLSFTNGMMFLSGPPDNAFFVVSSNFTDTSFGGSGGGVPFTVFNNFTASINNFTASTNIFITDINNFTSSISNNVNNISQSLDILSQSVAECCDDMSASMANFSTSLGEVSSSLYDVSSSYNSLSSSLTTDEYIYNSLIQLFGIDCNTLGDNKRQKLTVTCVAGVPIFSLQPDD